MFRKGEFITVQSELKENTFLTSEYFPFNIFHNTSNTENVLYTHWHDNIEIIYMVEGSAVFYVGEEAYSLEPGEIIFVNQGLLHSGYSILNTQITFYAIVFHPSILSSQSPDPIHSRFITPFMAGQSLFPGKVPLSNPAYDIIKPLIKSMIYEFEKKIPAYEIAVKSYLHLLVTQVLRLFPETQKLAYSTLFLQKNTDRFKNVISFVEKYYFEKITVEQASKIVNMSSFHFCKTFKRLTGRTFIEFVNLYRINKAEELLRGMNYSISEVAERVGFCNINYFDKVFKKYKRYSPSKCKNRAI
jgi:AraC family transcriptional regulator, transcriptional activator of pobA